MMKVLLLTFIFSLSILNASATELSIDKVSVSCGKSKECDVLTETFRSLKRKYSSLGHLGKILKIYLTTATTFIFKFTV